jgi:hypothetical protein
VQKRRLGHEGGRQCVSRLVCQAQIGLDDPGTASTGGGVGGAGGSIGGEVADVGVPLFAG